MASSEPQNIFQIILDLFMVILSEMEISLKETLKVLMVANDLLQIANPSSTLKTSFLCSIFIDFQVMLVIINP